MLPSPPNSIEFMPKMLLMKDKGSWICQFCSNIFNVTLDAYKNDSDDGEYHHRAALLDGFVTLVHGEPGLQDSSLLLFQLQQIFDLWNTVSTMLM